VGEALGKRVTAMESREGRHAELRSFPHHRESQTKQMHMLGHHYVADDHKAIALPRLIEQIQ